ncbi:MAG: hypothetical protein Q8942_12275 [Bacillota bacterium]|nr:hypothetical protein [Bacillota bacterium]
MADIETGYVARVKTKLRDDEVFNDRTNDVSVYWGANAAVATANCAGAGVVGNIKVVSVSDVLKKGGRVMDAPRPGSQGHCNLFGMKVKDFNNLFS